ncbi:VOC family protein [Variovorax paradoxus]|nr:VOC family protein [Variovorax paradoxus]MBT2303949.1 VOC family protein [Variovorax paradoxus]
MPQSIGQVAVVVRDYDEALSFYIGTLGFSLVEDTYVPEQNKRWVVVSPPGATESRLLLARAANGEQATRVGNQTGGRVFLFLFTDDFWRDFRSYKAKGVTFIREPKEEPYGTVAVFQDLYGNLWDLLQPRNRVCGRTISIKERDAPRNSSAVQGHFAGRWMA